MTERPADRIRVRRDPSKGVYDRATIHEILDRGLVGTVAFVDHGGPVCIPMLYARIEDRLFIHGSTASRMMRLLSSGAPACFSMTIVDGLVLARSAFEHSANYESVVAFGVFEEVSGHEERVATLDAFTDKLVPGRSDEARAPNEKELKATMVLAMSLSEASAKVRTGPPDDDDSEDAALPIWAGEIPMTHRFEAPIASPGLRAGVPVPNSVKGLLSET